MAVAPTRTMLDSIVDENGRTLKVEIRHPDGYFNATLMCKSAGKEMREYNRQKGTKSYIARLSATVSSRVELVSVSTGGNGERHTWVHPKVAEDLRHWCSRQGTKKGTSGYVYLATSPLLNAVKIGCWTGSLANLKSRYMTPYGPDVQIEHVFVPNCVSSENQMHVRFLNFNRGGELFDKAHALEYSDALRSLT